MAEACQVRSVEAVDLERIGAIQALCPGASRWQPQEYLRYSTFVAEIRGEVVGFLVYMQVVPGEYEILNVAVHPAWRRRGVASALLQRVLSSHAGTFFLEVRASNWAAISLYRRSGFKVAGRRTDYYTAPVEDAVVMKFHSC